MSDHVMESEGPWPAGWLWSLIAAVVSAVMARYLSEVSIQAAALMGLLVFVVFGVLLAQFWEAPISADHDHGHDAQASHDH